MPSSETGINTVTDPLRYLYIGAGFTGPTHMGELRYYMDDIVVAAAPIGCSGPR